MMEKEKLLPVRLQGEQARRRLRDRGGVPPPKKKGRREHGSLFHRRLADKPLNQREAEG